jgi:PPP family 3-phenylpropionic acid transporter
MNTTDSHSNTAAMRKKAFFSLSSLYFFYYAAAAALLPFLPVYYRTLHLTSQQIGILSAIIPLAALLVGPFWGWLSDITQRHKQILLLSLGGATICVTFLTFPRSFTGILALIIPFASFLAPVMPMIDSAVLQALDSEKSRYGQIRLWGSVSWGIMAFLIGAILESQDFFWVFAIYILFMFIELLIIILSPVRPSPVRPPGIRSLRTFILDPRWRAFLFAATTGGILLSSISNFLFLYLQDIGATKTLLGFSLTIATISEIPALFISSTLLKRWKHLTIMTSGLLFFAIRVLAYSFISNPWVAVWLQFLHGASFALMWAAGVSYAEMIAPQGLNTTAQSLFSGTMLGIGMAIGSLLGGALYDSLGANWMYRIMAAIALAGILILRSTKRL